MGNPETGLVIIDEMVFCFENCSYLLQKKVFLVIENKKNCKFKVEGRELSKNFRSQDQFLKQITFKLVTGGFYRSNELEQLKLRINWDVET